MKKGYIFTELLIVCAIILLVATISLRAVKAIMEKAKIASAKTQISQLALTLEQVKDDTGYYPVYLSDLTLSSPPNMQERNWKGPYVNEIPVDPWGNSYFYQIPPTTIFTSPMIPRQHGRPVTLTFEINSSVPPPQGGSNSNCGSHGNARLRIENHGITACTIWLNGTKIVKSNEFKNHPNPQIIEKDITLTGNDILQVRVRSTPGDYLYIIISGYLPTTNYFILGSYGRDGAPGGEGINKDIVWYSNRYPNFQ